MTSLRVVVFLLVLWTYAVGAAAATLLVPSEYLTIQSAVDAANTGDEIVVSVGVCDFVVLVAVIEFVDFRKIHAFRLDGIEYIHADFNQIIDKRRDVSARVVADQNVRFDSFCGSNLVSDTK